MKQAVICIAGAHRSGTSMLARLLRQCGLDLGPESDLMPAAADNPDGFWENLRFVQINDELLNAVGGAWDLPPYEDVAFQGERLPPIRAKAQLLIDSFRASSRWGWKDPRNCLTLPFWRALLPGLKTIVIVRNPLEAAYSMRKRNGTSYALGLRLWEIYNRRLLAHTQPDDRIVTDYQVFFDEPEAALRRIAAFADLPVDKEPAAAAALVAKERRHTSFTLEQLINAGVSESTISLYQTLLHEATSVPASKAKKARRAPKSKRRSPARTSSKEPDRLAGVAGALNLTVPEAETVRRELAWRRGSEVQHQETIKQLKARIESLTQEWSAKAQHTALELGRRDGRITELQTAYAHLDQVLAREQAVREKLIGELAQIRQRGIEQARAAEEQLAREREGTQEQLAEMARAAEERYADRGTELETVQQRFLQTIQLLQESSIRLADVEARNASLSAHLRLQLDQTQQLTGWLDGIARATDHLRHSRRWIIGNFSTWISARLAGRPAPGYSRLDMHVEPYLAWRTAHPDEVANLDEESAVHPLHEEISAAGENTAEFTPAEPALPIAFPTHAEVEVSIVIPVFNQLAFTLACLSSIQKHSDDVAFEVIVVDDGSTDATSEEIRALPGVVHLAGEGNTGFIASCNRGAAAARGDYLVFLNNDTLVTCGWLRQLLETFRFEPRAGLVGSKLVYPDGRLQDAGGIIWQDGSGWNRGKFEDAGAPEFNYLREVDYCTAASVMVPRELFLTIGGFDPVFAPAYYEDTDLAFRIAQQGGQVLYQPLSVVIHHEGATGGTDISAGTKKYQEVNRSTFVARWSDRLARSPVSGDLAAWDAPRPGEKRVLVIDHHLPMPDRDSGSLRMFQILVLLRQLGHRVTFIPDNLADIPPYGAALRQRGVEVIHHPYLKSLDEYLQAHGERFDVVILSRCAFAQKHIAAVRGYAPQSHVIFDTVDLHFLREEREAALTQKAETRESAARMRELEYRLIAETDETWVVSTIEQELLRATHPDAAIEVVSNIVDAPGSATPFALRRDFLFIGSFQHPPNVDAVVFFCREIFPLVQQHLPDVKFFVIGEKAPPAVLAFASEQIVVTGLQPDVCPYFDNVKLSVAPLRWGAGVKGKINQSMGLGVPVVATAIATEGMSLNDGEDVLVADRAEDFARAVVEVYRSEELWTRLSANGVAKTRAYYSRDAAKEQLARLFSKAARGVPAPDAAPITKNHRRSPASETSERH